MYKGVNQKGFSLIAILLVIVIIAVIGYGSLFFYKQKTQTQIYKDAYEKAEEDIININNKVDELNKVISDTAGEIKKDDTESEDIKDSEEVEENDIMTFPQ